MADSRAASRLELFDVVAPANTAKAAPVEVATNQTPGELLRLEIVIPDGHLGLTGIQLALAHSQALPYTRGAFIVGNAETVDFEMTGYGNSGAWSFFVYNTDGIAHTFHVRFHVLDFVYVQAQAPELAIATPLVA